MIRFRSYLPLTIAAGFAFVLFSGCPDDEPTDPGNGNKDTLYTLVKPGVGSEYVYDYHETTLDGTMIAGSEKRVVSTLLEKGLTTNGRSDVYRFADSSEGEEPSVTFIRYEQNNDLSILLDPDEGSGTDFGLDPVWVTIPFGSKTADSLRLIDTTVNVQGFNIRFTIDAVITYLGQDTVTLSGERLGIWKGIMETAVNAYTPIGTQQGSIDVEFDFAPRIGYAFAIRERRDVLDEQGVSVRTLTRYTLRN